ncbi:MAG TPA: GntR family transcriptional regulator [Burkholderiaceae bacterium]|nr:GntR family transcriptional regulator [Burkholderiaceae bacterium]
MRERLRRSILEGTLAPGDRLPSESALIDQHGVSRITVRQALADLQSAGLIATVNGKGSFVTRPDHPTTLGPLVGILETMRKRGYRAHAELVSHRVVAATREVAQALDIEPGSPVGALTVLRYLDDQPFAVGTTCLDVTLARRLAAVDLREIDVATAIAVELGMRPAETRCSISAVAAPRSIARRLRIEPGAPLLRVRTHTFDLNRRPVTWSQTDCRGDRMDYRVTLRS